MLVILKSLRVHVHVALSMASNGYLLVLQLLDLCHLLLVLETTEETHAYSFYLESDLVIVMSVYFIL